MTNHDPAPFLADVLGTNDLLYRTMPIHDQVALLWILANLKPAVAVEIGTYRGGSLQMIAHYAKKVYALDVNPAVRGFEKQFPNVAARVGSSLATLPALLRELSRTDAPDGPLGFILVDGCHERAAVLADLSAILAHVVPRTRLVVLLHDDVIPETRAAIRAAPWAECPFAYSLAFDLTPGIVCEEPEARGIMRGGFAMAVLGPAPRVGEFAVVEHAPLTHKCMWTGRDALRG
jgi:predicted O-methyltransferase YrrM